MIRRCDLTETAAKLSLQLEAYPIPDDFDAGGEDWEIIARVRDHYTNYRRLAEALPPCPDNCPPGKGSSNLVQGHCLTYEFAHHVLRTAAKQVAVHAYRAWRTRQQDNKVQPLKAGTAAVP